MCSIQTDGSLNLYRGAELLFIRGQLVDPAGNIHPLDHSAEDGKSLTVGIPLSTKIKFRLISNADDEMVRSRVRSHARHRERAVSMC